MLRSHLRLALRALRRRTSFAVVNAVGLTVGLACCAVVTVFLQYELTYDTHHADADRLYRVLSDFRSSTYSTISFEDYNSAGPDEQRALARRLPEACPPSSRPRPSKSSAAIPSTSTPPTGRRPSPTGF